MVNSTLIQWTVLKTYLYQLLAVQTIITVRSQRLLKRMLEAAHSKIEELEAKCVVLQLKTFFWIDFKVMRRV